jgi:hypothetical protein
MQQYIRFTVCNFHVFKLVELMLYLQGNEGVVDRDVIDITLSV